MTDIEDIVSIFELLGDWEQRYHYLVEVGEQLPPMPPHLKTEANRVKGCMSQVWVAALLKPGDPGHIIYYGDCDTAIIKGVLGLLVNLYSDRSLDEIKEIDAEGLFKRLQLEEHLSPSRHFGVYALVEMMQRQAAEVADKGY